MTALLIVAYEGLGTALEAAANNILGQHPRQLFVIDAGFNESPEHLQKRVGDTLSQITGNDGILILTDVYGSTHANVVQNMAQDDIQVISGVNLPMLLRACNYCHLPLAELTAKAMTGGCEGIHSGPD